MKRIKVETPDGLRVWVPIGDSCTIQELKDRLIDEMDLSSSSSSLDYSMMLDGCILRPQDNSELLRDGELVSLVHRTLIAPSGSKQIVGSKRPRDDAPIKEAEKTLPSHHREQGTSGKEIVCTKKTPSRSARRKTMKRMLRRTGVLPYGKRAGQERARERGLAAVKDRAKSSDVNQSRLKPNALLVAQSHPAAPNGKKESSDEDSSEEEEEEEEKEEEEEEAVSSSEESSSSSESEYSSDEESSSEESSSSSEEEEEEEGEAGEENQVEVKATQARQHIKTVQATLPITKATLPIIKATLPIMKATLPIIKATLPIMKATLPIIKATWHYSSLPLMPQDRGWVSGDIVAYRILEIDALIKTPELSEPRRGRVEGVTSQGLVQISPYPDPKSHPLEGRIQKWREEVLADHPGDGEGDEGGDGFDYNESPFASISGYRADGVLLAEPSSLTEVRVISLSALTAHALTDINLERPGGTPPPSSLPLPPPPSSLPLPPPHPSSLPLPPPPSPMVKVVPQAAVARPAFGTLSVMRRGGAATSNLPPQPSHPSPPPVQPQEARPAALQGDDKIVVGTNGAWSKVAEDLLAKRKEEILKASSESIKEGVQRAQGVTVSQSSPSTSLNPQSGITTRRRAQHQKQETDNDVEVGREAGVSVDSHRSARPGARRGALGPLLSILRRQDLENGSSLLDPSLPGKVGTQIAPGIRPRDPPQGSSLLDP